MAVFAQVWEDELRKRTKEQSRIQHPQACDGDLHTQQAARRLAAVGGGTSDAPLCTPSSVESNPTRPSEFIAARTLHLRHMHSRRERVDALVWVKIS
jgi:hypothetical protein